MNRKLLTTSLITIIILGLLQVVFADETPAKNTYRNQAAKLQEAQRKSEELRKDRQAERVQAGLSEEQKKLAQTASPEQRKALSERVQKKEVNRESVKRFAEEAKKQYESIKEKENEARDRLKQTREKEKLCKNKESEECKKLKTQVRANAHDFLLRTAERIIGLLSKAKERIEKSNLSAEEKRDAIAALETRISELARLKETLGEKEELQKEEVREASKLMRELWTKTKKNVRTAAGITAASKIGGVLKSTEKLQKKLEQIIEKAEEAGKDTSKIESLLNEFKSHTENAKAIHEEAKALFLQEHTSETMKSATEKLRLAHKELKESHSVLKKITQELRKTDQRQTV